MYKAIRYIGSKQKVLQFLDSTLSGYIKPGDRFFEAFAGTGIVSQHFSEKYNLNLCGGDISKYSKTLYMILNFKEAFQDLSFFWTCIDEIINHPKKPGFFVQEFSLSGSPQNFPTARNFFHVKSAETIDSFKDYVKTNTQLTPLQKDVLLFFLLAYSCKNANTTSVFGAFLKTPPKHLPFTRSFCEHIVKSIQTLHPASEARFYEGHVLTNLDRIEPQQLIYMDPPYSTRKYESNYHILNYVVDLDFQPSMIKENSKTALPKIQIENPFGSKKGTEQIFKDMILKGAQKSRVLAISYNTDGLIQEEWVNSFCQEQQLSLITHKLDYKRFKSNNNAVNTKPLEEILWIIQK